MDHLLHNISIIILTLGIILLVHYFTKVNYRCPPPKIKYRYIPMDFNTQQKMLPRATKVFSSMFQVPSPWAGYSDSDNEKFNKIRMNNGKYKPAKF